jgi:hypothetical protein
MLLSQSSVAENVKVVLHEAQSTGTNHMIRFVVESWVC